METKGFLIILLLLLFSGCVSSEKVASVIKGEEKFLRVGGGSMEPSIKSGSLVFYKAEAFESLKVGDIIVFQDATREGKPLVIRRIAAINADGTLTVKADAKLEPDPVRVTKDMYIGKVVS